MSYIALTVPAGGANTNPRSTFLPINIGGAFVDSLIKQPSDGLIQTVNNLDITTGLYIDTASFNYKFGEWSNENNNTRIEIDDINEETLIKSSALNLEIQAATVTGPVVTIGGIHAPSGRYLQLSVNGAPYLIDLLNP